MATKYWIGGAPAIAQVATTGTATTASSGPEHWDDADNWSSGTIPANTDTIIVDNTAGSIKYGLDQTAVELVKLVFGPGFTGTLGLPKRKPVARRHPRMKSRSRRNS